MVMMTLYHKLGKRFIEIQVMVMVMIMIMMVVLVMVVMVVVVLVVMVVMVVVVVVAMVVAVKAVAVVRWGGGGTAKQTSASSRKKLTECGPSVKAGAIRPFADCVRRRFRNEDEVFN